MRENDDFKKTVCN